MRVLAAPEPGLDFRAVKHEPSAGRIKTCGSQVRHHFVRYLTSAAGLNDAPILGPLSIHTHPFVRFSSVLPRVCRLSCGFSPTNGIAVASLTCGIRASRPGRRSMLSTFVR